MKDELPVSKELLNAFIDDELEPEERQDVITAQVNDPDVARELCELRILKDLVQAARPEEAKHSIDFIRKSRSGFIGNVANGWLKAGIAAAGTAIIIFTLVAVDLQPTKHEQLVLLQQRPQSFVDVAELLDAQGVVKSIKVVFHVKQDGSEVAKQLFAELEQILEYGRTGNRNIQVEVIATGPGLNLLRTDTSLYPDKISHISSSYSNVNFVACQRTMLRQAKTNNKNVAILPEALITYSGPELIKRRQKQGWATIII